jgi:hypothetical protein
VQVMMSEERGKRNMLGDLCSRMNRRDALGAIAVLTGAGLTSGTRAAEPQFEIATFEADVTPPLGHPLLGGISTSKPAERIENPLSVRGLVLTGVGDPLVVAAIDWCEIRNDAHDRWRDALAEAAATDRTRVIFSCVHPHDTPLADLEAERILQRAGLKGHMIDLDFHEQCVQSTAAALRDSLSRKRRVTQIGLGKARVEQLASNRRYIGSDGKPHYGRSSGSGANPETRDAEAGTIDPWLRMLSFWDGDRPVCAISNFAIHPMSYYGQGGVTFDYPGLARERLQAEHPEVFQIYTSGASGNVTAGKYNDAKHETRPILAQRLHAAMQAAWESTETFPLTQIAFRSTLLPLRPRDDAGLTAAELKAKLPTIEEPREQCLAALGISWRKRIDAGYVLDIPSIDFGPAQVLLLPGESYVEYQLYAQEQRPDSFVMTIGYGDCGTGYVPIERAWAEHDANIDEWGWVAPGSEAIMKQAIAAALLESSL